MMRPRTLRRRLILAGFGGMLVAGIATAGVARADGQINGLEAAYVRAFGTAICEVLDEHPNEAGLVGVGSVIMTDGFSPDNAADVVNTAVTVFCPWHQDLLARVGAEARGETPISGGIGAVLR